MGKTSLPTNGPLLASDFKGDGACCPKGPRFPQEEPLGVCQNSAPSLCLSQHLRRGFSSPEGAGCRLGCPLTAKLRFCCMGRCCLFPLPSLCRDLRLLGWFLNFHTWGEKSAPRRQEKRGAKGVAGLKGSRSKGLSCLICLCRSPPRVTAGPCAK